MFIKHNNQDQLLSSNVEYNISHCQVPEEEQEELFDAMKSFPSGHAQLACFTATFLIVSFLSFNQINY